MCDKNRKVSKKHQFRRLHYTYARACQHIHDGQIHGRTAAVTRLGCDVALLKQLRLIHFGIEIGLHLGCIQILCPCFEMVNHSLRSVSIIDLDPISLRHQIVADILQSCRRFISIDSLTCKVKGGVVPDFKNSIRNDIRNQNKAFLLIQRT